jgi:hypothetical protein
MPFAYARTYPTQPPRDYSVEGQGERAIQGAVSLS